MTITQKKKIEATITELYDDSKKDYLRMMKGAAKSIFRPIQPSDFKDAYLSISKSQGEELKHLIKKNNFKNIVEFGTSFGISTLFLAQAIIETGGKVITTELIESKAQQAIENFKKAGVNDFVEVRIGNAMKTLKNHDDSIDLLLLDGWKDLYLPLFRMLEPNFHKDTLIYVDNADMGEVQMFLKTISKNSKYQLQSEYHGKVVIVSIKN